MGNAVTVNVIIEWLGRRLARKLTDA